MKKFIKILSVIIIIIIIIGAMGFGTYKIINYLGEKNLSKKSTTVVPKLVIEDTHEEANETNQPLKEGEVLYKGKIYSYNKDIMTFAILGTDSRQYSDYHDGPHSNGSGMSDTIFLAVLDPHKEKIELIGINRNTMTDVWRYDTNGDYVDTVIEQICLQYAYLSGGSDSCEATVAAVDKLMYMIPIHGYFAMNMYGLTSLNDAIGGVELIPVESIPEFGITEGEKITLMGEKAFRYACYRDHTKAFTADKRLERQKHYLSEFVKKTKELTKKDLSVPLNLFNVVSQYSVTDITVDEMTYLVSKAINYDFSMEDIYSIPGETIQNEETEYEEFYVDEEKLHELIIEIFYEPVEE